MDREGELRKLFVRTDNRGYAVTLKTGRQALIELMALSPVAHKQTCTPTEARKQLTHMRYPPPLRTAAEARAQLTRMVMPSYETAESVGLHC